MPHPLQTSSESPQPGDSTTTSKGFDVRIHARANLPTRHGFFEIFAFKNTFDNLEHIAVVRGAVWGKDRVLVRLHSECLTGDVFGSLKCDCREQLERGIEALQSNDLGVILYMRQEGRGIGLAEKVRAYALQDAGLDTVEANAHLGFDDDLRDYSVAGAMLRLLRTASIRLMTNNPKKIRGLEAEGVEIAERVSVQIQPNPHNERYLDTKREKSGHILDLLD